MQNHGTCSGNVTPIVLQRLAVWAVTGDVETASTRVVEKAASGSFNHTRG